LSAIRDGAYTSTRKTRSSVASIRSRNGKCRQNGGLQEGSKFDEMVTSEGERLHIPLYCVLVTDADDGGISATVPLIFYTTRAYRSLASFNMSQPFQSTIPLFWNESESQANTSSTSFDRLTTSHYFNETRTCLSIQESITTRYRV